MKDVTLCPHNCSQPHLLTHPNPRYGHVSASCKLNSDDERALLAQLNDQRRLIYLSGVAEAANKTEPTEIDQPGGRTPVGGTLWPGFSRAAAATWQRMDQFEYTYMYARPQEKDCVGGGAISTIENLLDDGLISTKAKLGFPFLYEVLVGRLDLQVAPLTEDDLKPRPHLGKLAEGWMVPRPGAVSDALASREKSAEEAKAKAEKEAKRKAGNDAGPDAAAALPPSKYAEEAAQVEAITACELPGLAAFVLEAKTGGNVEAAVGLIMDNQGGEGGAALLDEMIKWKTSGGGGNDPSANDPMAGHHEPDEGSRLERCSCTTLAKLCAQAIAFRSTRNMTQPPHPADQAGFIGLAPLIAAAEADLAGATKAHLEQCAVGLAAAAAAGADADEEAEGPSGSTGPAGGIKIGGEPLKILQSDWTADLESVFAIGEKRSVVKAVPFNAKREEGGLENSAEVNGSVVVIMRGDISFSEKYGGVWVRVFLVPCHSVCLYSYRFS